MKIETSRWLSAVEVGGLKIRIASADFVFWKLDQFKDPVGKSVSEAVEKRSGRMIEIRLPFHSPGFSSLTKKRSAKPLLVMNYTHG